MIFKHKLLAAALATVAAVPASAASLLPSTAGVTFDAFDATTRGDLQISSASYGCSSPAATFCGTLRTAVYKNTSGTLDFYYQFARDGSAAGTDPVERITAGYFTNDYTVDAFFSDTDLDGSGIFTTSNNVGNAATASRTPNSGIVAVNFDISNPVAGSQTSATYIFRTNATAYSTGNFGVIDSQTYSGSAFMPAAVPEVSTWAMMVLGFGAAGAAVRRSRRTRVAFA